MKGFIEGISVDELRKLSHQERADSLVAMSIEMLDSLTLSELETITFDWFRAYHATMSDSNYIEIRHLSMMAPQPRRTALHHIVLARDDRSFDLLDEPTVQNLRAIFHDRKSNHGYPFSPSCTTANEFSVDESFFQPRASWGEQANELHTGLEAFNISNNNTGPTVENTDLECEEEL